MFKTFSAALLTTAFTQDYDWSYDQAYISQQLSLASYCGHTEYATHNWTGVIADFELTHIIYDKHHDTNGFVGVLPSDHSIYVVFRGSESLYNWMANLNADKDKYTVWPECGCKVHSGFQNCTNAVNGEVLAEVKRLAELYPTYAIKTTGHSLGAALAQLTAMMLVKNGF